MNPRPSSWRRLAAIAVLLGSLGLAWRAASQARREVEVTFLINRAAVRLGDAVVDRSRLVRLDWRVPTAPGAAGTLHAGSLHWAVGQAPEATPPLSMSLPPQVHAVEVRCTFALADGASVRTRGTIAVDPASAQQTWSVDECGTPEP